MIFALTHIFMTIRTFSAFIPFVINLKITVIQCKTTAMKYSNKIKILFLRKKIYVNNTINTYEICIIANNILNINIITLYIKGSFVDIS